MCFKVLHSFTHTCHPRFKFLFVNEPIGITVDQACDPSAELAHLNFQAIVLMRLRLGLETLPIFLLQPFGFFKQSAYFLPDYGIGLVHTQLFVPTYALEALARNIHRSCTAIIRITCIIGAPTISIPTFCTDQQALQEVAGVCWLL